MSVCVCVWGEGGHSSVRFCKCACVRNVGV